ncbi:hypothetical protein AX16_005377 [Volvariella volvacea WC 439]|nr:hypothetical protein AX16_005377 [Volvariella volvacea WC 439]
MSATLLAFKAGRAFRREGTSVVEPDTRKGAISLTNGEDGLLHFLWTNRATNEVEEDLILFPTDASFVKVQQAPSGRVYVLKFSSSNQRHFFWMQDASSARDEQFATNLNGVLQDPDYNMVWSSTPSGGAPQGQGSSSAAAASTTQPPTVPSSQTAPTSTFQATPEQLARLQELIASAAGRRAPSAPPEFSLTDILTPANLLPLFENHPELIPALFPHLPPDLPVPPSAEALQRIIHSPQFRSAVASFDQALRTGLLGNLVRGLGLPDEAGTGIGPFLRAIQEQADRERSGGASGSGTSEDTMDTD